MIPKEKLKSLVRNIWQRILDKNKSISNQSTLQPHKKISKKRTSKLKYSQPPYIPSGEYDKVVAVIQQWENRNDLTPEEMLALQSLKDRAESLYYKEYGKEYDDHIRVKGKR